MRTGLRAAVAISALAASLTAGGALANGGGRLSGSSWMVTGVGEFSVEPADGVTIEFSAGQIAGRSGCNRYTGPVAISADRVTIGPVAGTRMACLGRPMEIERSFLAALETITRWRIAEGGALELLAEDALLIRAVGP